jgi:DNA-3-methyladenine glycosylase II
MPTLPIPAPYDFELSSERFRAFGRDVVTGWRDGALQRAFAGREVRIAPADGGVEVEPLDGSIEQEVRHFVGLPFDLDGFRTSIRDPVLAGLERALSGFRPMLVPDPFEMLVGAIAAQQVSLFAATAIRNRLVERFGRRVGAVYAFPTARAVAGADPAELVALGFSRRKAEYVLAVARELPELVALGTLPDAAVKERIVRVRGLGEWTADWFLARHLGRPGAWPAGDLGLRKAVAAFYGPVDDVRAFGARFEPFQNIAAHYLLLGLRTR